MVRVVPFDDMGVSFVRSVELVRGGHMIDLLRWIFKCHHRKKHFTWPRKDREGYYVVCLDCGGRAEYTGELRDVKNNPHSGFADDTVCDFVPGRDEPWRGR
jgi:hypothetical protein